MGPFGNEVAVSLQMVDPKLSGSTRQKEGQTHNLPPAQGRQLGTESKINRANGIQFPKQGLKYNLHLAHSTHRVSPPSFTNPWQYN